MHLYNITTSNDIKGTGSINNIKRIDLISRGHLVYLYYMQYPAIKINKRELVSNINGKMLICVNVCESTVQYKTPRHRTSATFVLCTEESYTDTEPDGTMTLFYFPVTRDVAQYLALSV